MGIGIFQKSRPGCPCGKRPSGGMGNLESDDTEDQARDQADEGHAPLPAKAVLDVILGRDPAQASSIFLTTITDGCGFFIFLGLATVFLF